MVLADFPHQIFVILINRNVLIFQSLLRSVEEVFTEQRDYRGLTFRVGTLPWAQYVQAAWI
jgi:hypothetical protein